MWGGDVLADCYLDGRQTVNHAVGETSKINRPILLAPLKLAKRFIIKQFGRLYPDNAH